jgi:hypothetical protein
MQIIENASFDARQRMIELVANETFLDGIRLGTWLERSGLHAVLEEGAGTWAISSPRQIAPGIVQVRLEVTGPKLRETIIDAARRRQADPRIIARLEESHPIFDRDYVAIGSSGVPQVSLSIDELNVAASDTLGSPESSALMRRAAADAMLKRLRLDPRWHDLDMDRKLREPERVDRLRAAVAQFPADITDAGRGLIRVRLKIEARQLVETLADISQTPSDPRLDALAEQHAAAAAVAIASRPSQDGRQPIILPDAPPDWTGRPLTVSAAAPSTGSLLRTARAAEREARFSLRERILGLPLQQFDPEGPASVGDWIAQDPTRATIIDEMIESARTTGIDYAGDGSATARITIDPAPLWNLIRPR